MITQYLKPNNNLLCAVSFDTLFLAEQRGSKNKQSISNISRLFPVCRLQQQCLSPDGGSHPSSHFHSLILRINILKSFLSKKNLDHLSPCGINFTPSNSNLTFSIATSHECLLFCCLLEHFHRII